MTNTHSSSSSRRECARERAQCASKRNETKRGAKTSRVEEGRRRNTDETGGRPRRSDAAEDGEAKKEEKKEEKKVLFKSGVRVCEEKGKRGLGADNKNNTRERVRE